MRRNGMIVNRHCFDFNFFVYLCKVRIIKPVPRVLTKEYRAATWCSFFCYVFCVKTKKCYLCGVKNHDSTMLL